MAGSKLQESGYGELTDRELEILEKVATGVTNQAAALELGISVNTVKAHLRNVYAKLGVESRTEATLVAIQRGLVAVDGPDQDAQVGPVGEDSPATTVPHISTPGATPLQMVALGAAVVLFVLVLVWPLSTSGSSDPATRLLDRAPSAAAEITLGAPSRWRTLAQMPAPRSRFASVEVDGKVLAIGGIGPDGPSERVMEYDPGIDRWTYRSPKPTALANIGAALLDGLVYVPGGMRADGSVVDTVEVYDPAGDRWVTGPRLPHPLCAYAIASDDSGLYVLGGYDGRDYLDTVYHLAGTSVTVDGDTVEGMWREGAPLPGPIAFAAACVHDGRLFLVGGYDGASESAACLSRSIDDGDDARWRQRASMSVPRAGHAMALSQGSLYVIGGGWESPLPYSERYDVANDVWSPFETPISGEWRNLGVALGEARGGIFVLAMGGWNGRHLGVIEGYQVFFPVYLSTIEKGR